MLRRMIPMILALLPGAVLQAQGTLERIAERGEFRIGYRTDARPLSFQEDGEAAGYSVDICRRIAAEIRNHLRLQELRVTYVPVTTDDRIDAVVDRDIDIECGATTITLSRQARVDFTLMIFVTGGTILSRAENRIAAMEDLDGQRVAAIRGTTTAEALEAYLSEGNIHAEVVPVASREEGMTRLERGQVDGFASDQVVLLGEVLEAIDENREVELAFANELFSFEPYGFVVPRNDADFRLVANRAIARLFRSGEHAQLHETWIGSVGVGPSPLLLAMYDLQSLPE